MASNFIEYQVQLYNRRTGRPVSDSTGLFKVLTASTAAAATVYSDAVGTSLTQPGTMAGGQFRFWTDASVTSVDVTILAAAGQAYFVEGLTPSQHRVDVDPEENRYTFIVDWNGNTACGAVADTGFDLLVGMKIKDVMVHVTTVTTGSAMHFGISGTVAGFASLIGTTVTGFKTNDIAVTSSGTSTLSIVGTTQTRGVLIVDWATGMDTATGGNRGFFAKKPYVVSAATSLIYTPGITNSGGTGAGYLYIEYEILPTAGN